MLYSAVNSSPQNFVIIIRSDCDRIVPASKCGISGMQINSANFQNLYFTNIFPLMRIMTYITTFIINPGNALPKTRAKTLLPDNLPSMNERNGTFNNNKKEKAVEIAQLDKVNVTESLYLFSTLAFVCSISIAGATRKEIN